MIREFDNKNEIANAVDYVYGNEEESTRAADMSEQISPFVRDIMDELFS